MVKRNESFCYLGSFYNFPMDNAEHKQFLLSETSNILEKNDCLPLHPKFKHQLYMKYLFSKISWHLTIADIDRTWIEQTLDTMCHNTFRAWLEFGFNIIDVSTKLTECQVILRNKLKESNCLDTKNLLYASSSNFNVQYDAFSSAKQVAKEIRKDTITNFESKLTSQSLIIKSICPPGGRKDWHSAVDKLPQNIYNFVTRYLNNTLPNLVLWKKAQSNLYHFCLNAQTLQHIVSSCKTSLDEGRFMWRHNSVLKHLATYISGVRRN